MPLSPAPEGAALPAAVPPLDANFDHACRELGRSLLYVAQLSSLLNERAVEANTLDDQLQAARLRIQELERDNQGLRHRVEVAEAALVASDVMPLPSAHQLAESEAVH